MKAIRWNSDHIELIDQRKLPGELQYIDCYEVETLGEAIRTLAVRGAPALGIAAGFGVALAAFRSRADNLEEIRRELLDVSKYIASTRPTAVNLFWALDRMMKVVDSFTGSFEDLKDTLLREALEIASEDEGMCFSIGNYGAELVKPGANILHHCNTGFLATGEYGTALGVIRSAHRQGKNIHVFVDETRPLLQGSRLTAWELLQDGIPHTVITDNMAGYLMKLGKVDMVILGADRITARGDVANKIGTYSLAVLARYHGIPFYSAAPFSTVDLSLRSGEEIVIEERIPEEVLSFMGVPSAPAESPAFNPSFDVTPHELITGIITERGVVTPPFEENLRRLAER